MISEKPQMQGNTFLLTLSGGIIYVMSSGVRSNYGLMLGSIVETTGVSFVTASFVLAVGQLLFGATQPGFGVIGAKKGNFLVLLVGTGLMLVGMLGMPLSRNTVSLLIFLGVILPAGTGALSYSIIMGTITPKLPEKSVSIVSGLINACNGVGNILLSPVISSLLVAGGLMYGMVILSVPMVLLVPIAFYICRNKKEPGEIAEAVTPQTAEKTNTKELFAKVLRDKTYIYLMIGFFTCGFHMAIIMNHLATELASYGFAPDAIAYAFSIYGATAIAGSVISGYLCSRLNMKNVLGCFYGSRSLIVIAFLLMPKTLATMFFFTAFLGFTGIPTVPPVTGILRTAFGVKYLAILFGFVFFIHQIGAFLSAWFSGIYFDATDGYVTMWIINIGLSALAAAVSFAIDNRT